MIRFASVLALSGSLAWGQFTGFSATDDGHHIYFTTILGERNAPDQVVKNRIFRLEGRRLESFAEDNTPGEGASSLHVSGDGQSVAFVQSTVCPPDQPCLGAVRKAEIRGRYAGMFGDAERILLSRNGRWALVVPPRFAVQPPIENSATLINLETGVRNVIGRPFTSGEDFALASDGSVLVGVAREGGGFTGGVSREGQFHAFPPISGTVFYLGLSDDASTVLASRLNWAPGQPVSSIPSPDLVVVDLRTSTARSLGVVDGVGLWFLLGMGADGRRALVTTLEATGPGRCLVVDLRTGALHPLKLLPGERAVVGTVVGQGGSVVVGTSAGRIIRFAIQADGRPAEIPEELLPPTPYIGDLERPIAPGLRREIDAPLPGDIDWRNRIRVDGHPVAILGQAPGRLEVQFPWEARIGVADLSVDYPTASPLVQRGRPFVAAQAPAIAPVADGSRGLLGGRLIKGDFSGPATEPLRPGDIVHLYFVGLGPVVGPVQTGVPAPTAELRPLASAIRCRFLPGFTSDGETLFAGLAPGMVGIYQLTMRAPDGTFPRPTGVQCRFGNESGYSYTLVLRE